MKITLSKVDDPRGRHVVLVVPNKESWSVRQVITSSVLQGQARPVEEKGSLNTFFRFNLKYLDRLSLTFPFAELSPGVHRRLKRAEEVRLKGMRIPKIRIPGFLGKLYDFQKIATGAIVWDKYAQEIGYPEAISLLNDEMGLGKTFVILAAIARLQAFPALICVPNNAKYTWAEVVEEFFPDMSCVVYDTQEQSPAERSMLLEQRADITIVNIEAIRARAIHEEDNRYLPIVGWQYANPELFDFEYAFGVLDEHHRVKTPGAQVTNGFFQLQAKRWVPMSGTPILNRPEEIWTVLYKLWPEDSRWETYQTFLNWIGIPNPNDSSRLIAYHPEAMGELRDFIQAHSMRRRKDQVLKDLPEVITSPRIISLSTEERRLYNKIEDEMMLEMEDGTIKNIGGALPQITRLKQACFSPELYGGSPKSSKIEELKLIVKELVASGEKALVFSQWEKACKIIQRELAEYNPAYVTGKVKTKARQDEIRKFREDEDCHLYIGTIDANREAINLGSATYVIFTDEGWTPAGNDQAIGRSAAGGLRGVGLPEGTKVTVIVLQAEDTYEQNVESLLKRKRMLFDRMVERDGGKIRKIEKVTLNDIRAALSSRAQKKKRKKSAA